MSEQRLATLTQANRSLEQPVGSLKRADDAHGIDLSLTLTRWGEAAFDLSVDLTLPSSGTTVIFGPSGGGKTTILRAIAGPALEVMNHPDAPLALRDDAGVVVQATVQQRDAHGLLTLESPRGELYAHGLAHEPGDRLRVRIHARDVSLALSHHTDSSMLNILPVTVLTLRDGAGGQALIELSAGDQAEQRLLAKISHASVARLNIAPGLALWAQIKAVALLV